MSLHNEWASQYHKILKALFLNLCSSQDVQSHSGNEWGNAGWAVPPVTHVSGETQRPVVVGCGPGCGKCTFSSQLRCWPVFQLHKSQDFLLCILKLQGTEQHGYLGIHAPLQVWAVRMCTFAEYLGGASLLGFLAFLCVLAIFVCLPSEDPGPCLVKQSQKRTLRRKTCCNHVSWDQFYQLHPAYDTLSCSHKNEVFHLAHLTVTLTWRLWGDSVFVLSRQICSCPHVRADGAVWALILCAFQSIVGNFEVFLSSGSTSGYAGSLLSQGLLLTVALSFQISMWIRKMLKYRRISYSYSLPYSSFLPYHSPDFLT